MADAFESQWERRQISHVRGSWRSLFNMLFWPRDISRDRFVKIWQIGELVANFHSIDQ